ncbi:UPF0481 protein At3g47200-like isoform X1 [Nicotiana sylvestris]|uniref:UPF0481 protein At3g02645 isoform X1 n=1 Tax=Nicotiana sylvestris TaxID=4096 RepID=A0A1U7XNU1_NICSY|nr:PREDICTED: putative UPF0481 protein At3g02645 isoform X1 [Nicotiana sylvestris]
MSHHIEITQMDHQIPLLYQTSVNEATDNEIEEGRKVDYLIDIEETNGQDQSRLQAIKSAKQIYDRNFKDFNNPSIKSTTIFKVSAGLSESNPNAYKPMLITIGPYHKHNTELRSIEKYKLMYLQRFLRRKEGIDMESYIREMEELKDEACKCYDNIHDFYNDNIGEFLLMLLLDGCFVVEYIRECCGIIPTGEDIIISGGCLDNQVRRDLLLLENQLPFFVLAKLHDMTMDIDQTSFIIMVKCAFLPSLPKITPASFVENEGNAKNIKHILQLVHMSCHPSDMNNPSIEIEHCGKSLIWIDIMPNATELCEAGVSFTKVGTVYTYLEEDNFEDCTSLFDIKFENGLMKIPCFEVVDDTETILRNLIAYEQQSPNEHSRYFSDYAVFMDHLIDSEKDVNLLRLKGVIRNRIGEDKEVANLFNKIGKGVSISSDFYYKEECRKVVQHCQKPWNRMKANLRHNYFHSPWAGVSTVAAIILLLLTVIQTILSFISVLIK